MSATFKIVERFIAIESISRENEKYNSLLQLVKYYRQKGLKRQYELAVKRLQKHISKKKKKDKQSLFDDFTLQQIITEDRSMYNSRQDDVNLKNTIERLDNYYLAARLEYTNALLAQDVFHNKINTQEAILFIERLVPLVDDKKLETIPLILVLKKIYILLRHDISKIPQIIDQVKQLEALLKKYQNRIEFNQLCAFHSFSRSLISYLLNRGAKELNSYAFLVYKDHLNRSILNYGDGIHAANFKNIVSIALIEKKYQWVKKFLEKNKGEIIGTEFPEEVYQYNLANYYFHVEKYEEAQDALSDHYEDLYYKLAAKRLEIKIYYELGSELLEYKLNAFKQFIHRLSKNKLPEVARLSNNNFINALKQILSPANMSNTKRKKLIHKIQAINTIKDKDWLISIL